MDRRLKPAAFIGQRALVSRRLILIVPTSALCNPQSVSYILPLRARSIPGEEFTTYVNTLGAVTEMIVVDGSEEGIFEELDRRLGPEVRHVRPDPAMGTMRNGKVHGVLTGLRLASHENVVLADDDVRYSVELLSELVAELKFADVVRPQNFFAPLPWHARIDTARTLINRATGGDWPGTLAVRRSTLARSGGYDGNVLFENLELVRTVQAAGGREVSRPDLFVRRLPPPAPHFWRQRIRQAYDEFARPVAFGFSSFGAALPPGTGAGGGSIWAGARTDPAPSRMPRGGGAPPQWRPAGVPPLLQFVRTDLGPGESGVRLACGNRTSCGGRRAVQRSAHGGGGAQPANAGAPARHGRAPAGLISGRGRSTVVWSAVVTHRQLMARDAPPTILTQRAPLRPSAARTAGSMSWRLDPRDDGQKSR